MIVYITFMLTIYLEENIILLLIRKKQISHNN